MGKSKVTLLGEVIQRRGERKSKGGEDPLKKRGKNRSRNPTV